MCYEWHSWARLLRGVRHTVWPHLFSPSLCLVARSHELRPLHFACCMLYPSCTMLARSDPHAFTWLTSLVLASWYWLPYYFLPSFSISACVSGRWCALHLCKESFENWWWVIHVTRCWHKLVLFFLIPFSFPLYAGLKVEGCLTFRAIYFRVETVFVYWSKIMSTRSSENQSPIAVTMGVSYVTPSC